MGDAWRQQGRDRGGTFHPKPRQLPVMKIWARHRPPAIPPVPAPAPALPEPQAPPDGSEGGTSR